MKELSNIGLLAMLLAYALLAFDYATQQDKKPALILPVPILFWGGFIFWRRQKRSENEEERAALNEWVKQLVSSKGSSVESPRKTSGAAGHQCPVCQSKFQNDVTSPVRIPNAQHVFCCRDCKTVWAKPKPLWPLIGLIVLGFVPILIALLVSMLGLGMNYGAAVYFIAVPWIFLCLFIGCSNLPTRKCSAIVVYEGK